MRVNPILDWTYEDIWEFIVKTKIGYCSLYNVGYTSVGNTQNTIKNDSLKGSDGEFVPAFHLKDTNSERKGRNLPKSTPPTSPPPHISSDLKKE